MLRPTCLAACDRAGNCDRHARGGAWRLRALHGRSLAPALPGQWTGRRGDASLRHPAEVPRQHDACGPALAAM
eukprot:1214006-Lingulodinium_polyedra.AAC.1